MGELAGGPTLGLGQNGRHSIYLLGRKCSNIVEFLSTIVQYTSIANGLVLNKSITNKFVR